MTSEPRRRLGGMRRSDQETESWPSYGQRKFHSYRTRFPLGQRVSRRDDPPGTIGVVVAIFVQVPFCALVTWSDEIWTLEPHDALTDVGQHPL
jgi:hypothetical protein